MSAVLPGSGASAPMREAGGAARDQTDDSHTTVTGAIARLELSRAQLRTAMLPTPKEPGQSSAGGLGAIASRLTDRVRAMPGAGVLMDAAETWWAQHPLRTAGLVAVEASRKFAAPLAERNPLALVGGAVVFGAVLTMTRPWRWLLRPALFAGLLPALAMTVVRQLPLDTLLRIFGTDRTPAEPASTSTSRAASTAPARPPGAAAFATPAATAASVTTRSKQEPVPTSL
jgi:hypothetical protein